MLIQVAKLTIYFLQLIFNVRVHNRGCWQFTFQGVDFYHDSHKSYSVHHESRTTKMVDHEMVKHGVTKISLPPLVNHACKSFV